MGRVGRVDSPIGHISPFKYNIQYFCGVKNDMSILLKRNIETNEQSRGYGVMGTRQ